uniref:Uncharacterized protein n=1 Tax=Glossina palpalis gambiensis TaxID=67801 RepID=A0A1B0BGJ2_9MUSC
MVEGKMNCGGHCPTFYTHLWRSSSQNENTDQQSHIFEKSLLTRALISTFTPENFYYTSNHNNHNNNDDYLVAHRAGSRSGKRTHRINS